jgi:hypothetical protein
VEIAGCQGNNRKTLEPRRYLYEMYGLTGAALHWQKRKKEEFVGDFVYARVSEEPDVDWHAQNVRGLVEDVNFIECR